MNLTRLEIEGFRAYREAAEFDCAGDAVVLIGPNGFGKTSFFDAIGWTLFGRIRRLTGSRDAVGDDYIRNRFAKKAGVEVRLYIRRETETALVTRKMTARADSQLDVVVDGVSLGSRAATRWVSQLFRGPNSNRDINLAESERLFERCVLLPQDQLTAFIRETSPRGRFDVIAALLGVDVARDFYIHLSSHLSELEEETRSLESELRSLDQRIERTRLEKQDLEQQAGAARRLTLSVLRSDIRVLTKSASGLLEASFPTPSGASVEQMLELTELLETSVVRALARAEMQRDSLNELIAVHPNLSRMRRQLTKLEARMRQLEGQLRRQDTAAEKDEVERNRLAVELSEAEQAEADALSLHQELADFLTIARDHVSGSRCPVCEQGIDAGKVIRRLDARISRRVCPQFG